MQACTNIIERFFCFQGANQEALEISSNCSPASGKQQKISFTMKNHSMQKLSVLVWKKHTLDVLCHAVSCQLDHTLKLKTKLCPKMVGAQCTRSDGFKTIIKYMILPLQ